MMVDQILRLLTGSLATQPYAPLPSPETCTLAEAEKLCAEELALHERLKLAGLAFGVGAAVVQHFATTQRTR